MADIDFKKSYPYDYVVWFFVEYKQRPIWSWWFAEYKKSPMWSWWHVPIIENSDCRVFIDGVMRNGAIKEVTGLLIRAEITTKTSMFQLRNKMADKV